MSSIHGSQFLLPLFIRNSKELPIIEDDAELSLALYLCTKDLDNSHKILSFSKLLWPFLSIQGVISTHIILDGLKVFSKKDKFTNPPRQPLIGHILRNIDNLSYREQLNRIIDVLKYEDNEAKEVGEGEESEFQVYQIESLTNPEFLNTLKILIPELDYRSIEGYMPLDTTLATENALDLAEKYRNIIKTLKGNAHRWETQINLIDDYVEKWLLELNVQIKDISSRYKSQINKTSLLIDGKQVEELVKEKSDNIEQQKIIEKKKILENISVQFKGLDRELEQILKRNRFYSSEETIKRKSFENVIHPIENHFNFLEGFGNKYSEIINSIKGKFEDFKNQAKQIDIDAKEKVSIYKKELEEKLQDRDNQISKFQVEKSRKLDELETRRQDIENLFSEVKKIILEKKNDCLREADRLNKWAIQDTEAELFARPIQWIYMPLYAMFVEDESMMDEYMKIVLPGHIYKNSQNQNKIYEISSDAMANLKDFINEKIEDDMALRSNFEFSCENNNILKIVNLEKRIQKGIADLRRLGIIDEKVEELIRNKMSSLT